MKKRATNKPRAKAVPRRADPENVHRRVPGSGRSVAAARQMNGLQRARTTAAYQADERRALMLLLLPVLLLATALGISQSLLKAAKPWIGASERNAAALSPTAFPPEQSTRGGASRPVYEAPGGSRSNLESGRASSSGIGPQPQPALILESSRQEQIAAWTPPTRDFHLDASAFDLAALIRQEDMRKAAPSSTAVCRRAPAPLFFQPPTGADFGTRLAAAAEAQTVELVIYSAKYRRIGYPMGDIPAMYGACTEVVIRAYRSLGIDLQERVQRARLGKGDASIDHRRTETLRSYFTRHAELLPISAFPEDYKPGDIVTYHRPFSRVSRSHIAIVSRVIAPTRRPMIVHNRGWGPQLEDALFIDRITGHYRLNPAPIPASAIGRPARRLAHAHRGLYSLAAVGHIDALSLPSEAQNFDYFEERLAAIPQRANTNLTD